MTFLSRLAGDSPEPVGVGDTEPFALRLAQAIAWSAPRANPADPRGSLRYDQLQPRVLEVDRATTVYSVVRQRETYLRRDIPPVASNDGLESGRLLAYFPDAELSDGAAEAETGGYFDVNNAPPWDTWVALLEDVRATDTSYRALLVAWVPSAFLAAVERGIFVNPESCIVWLSNLRAPVVDRLRSKGLLR